MTKKKIITESKDYVSPSDLDGKLSDLKRKIEDLITEYGPDARLEYDAHFWHLGFVCKPQDRQARTVVY